MVEAYDTGLHRIVDHHAPSRETIVTMRPDSPWYTDELHREKHDRRRAERTWLRNGLVVHRQAYRKQCVTFNHMLLTEERSCYSAKIANCGNDQNSCSTLKGTLWETMTSPNCRRMCLREIWRNDYFTEKVNDIRESKDLATMTDAMVAAISDDTGFCGVPLTCFAPVIESDIMRLVVPAIFKRAVVRPLLEKTM